MTGRINGNGLLIINDRDQYCFHQQGETRCGDWCPAFREPIAELIMGYGGEEPNLTGRTQLELCKEVGVLKFDELLDWRK